MSMTIPKLTRYCVEEMLNGEPCGYAMFVDAHGPEEAVEHYLNTGYQITMPIKNQITFFVESSEFFKYYVKATYGWSCKQVCMPEELK